VNLNEFRAWFEGFGENLDGPPDKRQWARIKEKIEKIADAPSVTQHVFHNHYYRPWQRWFEVQPYILPMVPNVAYTSAGADMANNMSVLQAQTANVALPADTGISFSGSQVPTCLSAEQGPTLMYTNNDTEVAEQFDSDAAFRELGRAEFRSIR
jgi:hypothetical protein